MRQEGSLRKSVVSLGVASLCGAAIGVLGGLLVLIVLRWSAIAMDGTWMLILILSCAVPSSVNGVIGYCNGTRRLEPVVIVPALTFVLGVVLGSVLGVTRAREWLLIFSIIVVIVWIAGRIGQRIGEK